MNVMTAPMPGLINESVLDMIGDTPMVELQTIGSDLGARIAIKLESRNPGGSVKDRVGRSMIDDAA